MMGKIVVVVKRWWLLALIATLAMSLTSCHGKRRSTSGNAALDCSNGNIGTFTVSTELNSNGMYDIYLYVDSAVQNGFYSDLYLYSADHGDMQIRDRYPLVVGDENLIATVSYEQFLNYDILAITEWTPGNQNSLSESSFEYDAACTIPDPSDPNYGGGY